MGRLLTTAIAEEIIALLQDGDDRDWDGTEEEDMMMCPASQALETEGSYRSAECTWKHHSASNGLLLEAAKKRAELMI